MMLHEIERCRICGNGNLRPILHLGSQYLSGVFPRRPDSGITRGPLELVKCHGDGGAHCGLVQLHHCYDLGEMYGENYGYRSSLNRSMVEHLREKMGELLKLSSAGTGDLVIDIGSNDGTLLSFCPPGAATLVGIDPTAGKFRQCYRPDIQVITDFFSADAVRSRWGQRKARLVTSIAMFYDLPDPMGFVRQVGDILAPDGIWHLEQSYLPSMLRSTSYDTVCHEHIEYYALRQIKWMTERAGLKILDVRFNDINGGSLAVTVAKASAPYPEDAAGVERVLRAEDELGLSGMAPYEAFARRAKEHKDKLLELLRELKARNAKVLGYGASTKGNVILQYCGIGAGEIAYIAEVNPDKFGCFTPGTNIPIISEGEARGMKPDYFLVLPWHFRENLLKREEAFIRSGGRMIFPLPEIEIVPR